MSFLHLTVRTAAVLFNILLIILILLDDLQIHPNFTLWILKCRPSSPVDGQGFLNYSLDCFSLHRVPTTEIEMIFKHARPSFLTVDESIFHQIFKAFDELRLWYESGDIDYPFS